MKKHLEKYLNLLNDLSDREIVNSNVIEYNDIVEILIQVKKSKEDLLEEYILSLGLENKFELSKEWLRLNGSINYFILNKICMKIEQLFPDRCLIIDGNAEWEDSDEYEYGWTILTWDKLWDIG